MDILAVILVILIVYNIVYNIPTKLKEHNEDVSLKFKELYIRINRLEKMIEEKDIYNEDYIKEYQKLDDYEDFKR
ncbi:hypothetical protein [Clostridium sp.]|uniref:hypothetical protein n=1 Tax=Clostridium sp. TaxID=1506 RepID=UPI002FC70F15